MNEPPESQIFDPRGTVTADARRPAPRLQDTGGARIAVLDNTKWNAGSLLRAVAARLEERMDAPRLRFYKKESFSRTAAEDLLDEIAGESDAVLTAIGD